MKMDEISYKKIYFRAYMLAMNNLLKYAFLENLVNSEVGKI